MSDLVLLEPACPDSPASFLAGPSPSSSLLTVHLLALGFTARNMKLPICIMKEEKNMKLKNKDDYWNAYLVEEG